MQNLRPAFVIGVTLSAIALFSVSNQSGDTLAPQPQMRVAVGEPIPSDHQVKDKPDAAVEPTDRLSYPRNICEHERQPMVKEYHEGHDRTASRIAETERMQILEEQQDVLESAWIRPVMRNGETVGIRLFGIGQCAFLREIGFRNGDLLKAVNDMPISSPSAALDAYAALLREQEYHVDIERNEAPMKLIVRFTS